MPHKHKRKAGDDDNAQFNLPPTVRATALPVSKTKSQNDQSKRSKKRKIAHIEGYGQDDMPKAFQRLMAFSGGAKKRSGLDDGLVKSKKQKRQEQLQQQEQQKQQKSLPSTEEKEANKPEPQPTAAAAAAATPKILPGESMFAFAQRVDAALPLTGINKNGKKIAGVNDHRVTKHEKKLKRLQKGWREEEARIRDKEAEEAELAEEENDEHAAMWEDKTADLPSAANGKKKAAAKGKKRKKVVGEVDNHSEDEWAALERSRVQRKGLHDVVSAPPEFKKIPREIFKVKNGAGAKVGNVPNAAGSLRKREELGEVRKTIIETYRELMAAKKAKVEAGAQDD
ncbi:hypothetical protein P153DRAFT_388465 [Dothidotthia symphoricarpi CBS 119687]|uniref:Uncharacterized protein n=1 Tax=Dothidotthia symphoricarpi CBS 119687 TaxID=1392245 RepID=A0A6A6A5H2_9PLEO|nr:uncharacterized protein P153DRAFT_388465 [Dothidotthia symphoricarpi CBS 119687]KAF2126423.1 hypothetical protein P153DRAFT_388465 [Dothidotthia symphoricarpi CBS 119687]